MGEKVVIIGGGAAGPKTAAKLRRERKDLKIDNKFEKTTQNSLKGEDLKHERIIK